MTKDETLKLALETLKLVDGLDTSECITIDVGDVIDAVKKTLAQPEQEPVLQDIEQYRLQMAGISTAALGYWKEGDDIHPDYDTVTLRDVAKLYEKYDALYKAQQEQEPWLLESTQTLAKNLAREFYPEVTQWECLDDLAGVISQIDNMTTGLMRKTEQEPVAWAYVNSDDECEQIEYCTESPMPEFVPLYTSPPKRQPLTEEQAKKLLRIGPVYAPDGVVTRTPLAYRKELLETALWAFRKTEAAHGIKEMT